MKPFPFVREVWPEKVIKEINKLGQAKGGVELDKQMYVLFDNKPTELLMFWDLEYKAHIIKDGTMTPIAKLDVLKPLVKNNALGTIEDGMKIFKDATELSDIDDFRNPDTKINI